MEEKLYELNNFRLHTLYNPKYKKCTIAMHFREELSHEQYKKNVFLTALIARGIKSAPSIKELNKKKEYLYGALTSSYSKSVGKLLETNITIDFLNPKYVDELTYLDEILEFIFDYLKNPVLDPEELSRLKEEFILNEKKKEEHMPTKANKGARSTLDCAYSINYFDSIEEIENTTLEEIKESLDHLINDTTIDIYVFGDLDMELMKSKIEEYAPFTKNENKTLEFDSFVSKREKVELVESGKFEQSMVYYYYSLKDMDRDSRIYAAVTLGDILGGGLNSLLYKDIREKHSLCYTLSAWYVRHFDLLQIAVGVDKKNIEKTKERIEYVMSNLDTLITEDKVKESVLASINAIKTNIDDSDYLIYEADTAYTKVLDKRDIKLEKFSKISLEDVKALIPKLDLYSIYVLEGDKNE